MARPQVGSAAAGVHVDAVFNSQGRCAPREAQSGVQLEDMMQLAAPWPVHELVVLVLHKDVQI